MLDLECSDGEACLALARGGFRIAGLDRSADAITRARAASERLPAEVRERVRFLRHEGTEIPFPPGSFDSVIVGDLLAGSLAPDRFLSEVVRVLRPGGTMVISVAYGARRHHEHTDAVDLRGIMRVLEPFGGVGAVEIVGGCAMIALEAGRAGRVPDDVLLALAEGRVVSLSTEYLVAEDRIEGLEAELVQTRRRLEQSTDRARRFEAAYERQRSHWSWRIAVELARARRAVGGLLRSPVRGIAAVVRRLRRRESA